MKRKLMCVMFTMAATMVCSARAETWNAFSDFSSSTSSSAWTYGWMSTNASGSDTYYSDLHNRPTGGNSPAGAVMVWSELDPATDHPDPSVSKNTTSSPVDIYGFNYAVDQLTLYGGWGFNSGEAGVVSFTAPTAGDYTVNATITNLQSYSQTISIAKNASTLNNLGTTLYSGSIEGGASYVYAETIALNAGETISFIDSHEAIGLAATITTLPEPNTLILMAAAAIGMLAYAWRRRK